MKGIFFICFLFANALITDAQNQHGIYKVTGVSDPLIRINGVRAELGLSFNSIQEIQFMNCQNAYILAEKTSIHSSLCIGSRCQGMKIIPYVVHEFVRGLAQVEIPAEYNPLQNQVEKNFAPASYSAEVPTDRLNSRDARPGAYDYSTNSMERNFNSSNDLHNTIVGVIIIGSFQVKSNAENEFLRIQAEGHQAYFSTFGTYTRVGIWFSYNRPSELDQMITAIRDKYNPDAFFIKVSSSNF